MLSLDHLVRRWALACRSTAKAASPPAAPHTTAPALCKHREARHHLRAATHHALHRLLCAHALTQSALIMGRDEDVGENHNSHKREGHTSRSKCMWLGRCRHVGTHLTSTHNMVLLHQSARSPTLRPHQNPPEVPQHPAQGMRTCPVAPPLAPGSALGLDSAVVLALQLQQKPRWMPGVGGGQTAGEGAVARLQDLSDAGNLNSKQQGRMQFGIDVTHGLISVEVRSNSLPLRYKHVSHPTYHGKHSTRDMKSTVHGAWNTRKEML